MSTVNATRGRPRSTELSPLDVVELEAVLEPFCPTAMDGGQYQPARCLPWCNVCESLLIKRREV